MFWPFSKKKEQNNPCLSEFDNLIIRADKTMSEYDRNNLYAAIDRKGYSDEQYNNYRTSLYTRLAKSGDTFAQCQLGDLAHLQKTNKRSTSLVHPFSRRRLCRGYVQFGLIL